MLERFLNRFRGYLVEDDSVKRQGAKIGGLEKVPGDRLTFAVGVCRQVDVAGLLGCIADLFNGAGLFLRHNVFGEEPIVDLDTKVALGKIADVAYGRFNVVFGAEDARNCPCLGGRLDYNETFAVPCRHSQVPSATRARAAAAD